MNDPQIEAAIEVLIASNPDYNREALRNMSSERLGELIEERIQEAMEAQLEERRLRTLARKMQQLEGSGD